MFDEIEFSVECPGCETLRTLRCPLVDLIRFPGDEKKIVDLLARRLHVHPCPACDMPTSFFVPLLVMHETEHRVLIAVPESIADETIGLLTKALPNADREMDMKVCDDYAEMYRAICPWVNEIILPFARNLMADGGEKFDPSRATRLILAMFHAQAEGVIEPFIATERDGMRIGPSDMMGRLHVGLVTDVLTDLRKHAVKDKTMAVLEETLRNRVPVECIVDKVLKNIVASCPKEFVDPFKSPGALGLAFARNFFNASVHAYCGRDNPLAQDWAATLVLVWKLGKRSDSDLDPQFRLPPEVIRRTAHFSDLWTMCGALPKEPAALEAEFNDREEMFLAYGFARELEEMLKSGMIRIKQSSDMDLTEFAEIMDEVGRETLAKILKRAPLDGSEESSGNYAGMVRSMVGLLAKNGQLASAKSFASGALEVAIKTGDAVAVVKTATACISALNEFGENVAAGGVSNRVFAALGDVMKKVAHSPQRALLLLNFFNENGNLMRYLGHFDNALGMYAVCESLFGTLLDVKKQAREWAILRRNQAIVYREMRRYRKAGEAFEDLLKQAPDDPNLLLSTAMLHLETGDQVTALRHMDHAIHVTSHCLLPEDQAKFLLARGVVRVALEDAEGGFEDLARAFGATMDGGQLAVAANAACAVVGHFPFNSRHADVVGACVEWLEEKLSAIEEPEKISDAELSKELSLRATLTVSLGEHHLTTAGARRALSRLREQFIRLDPHWKLMPWQYHLLRSRVEHGLARFKESAAFLGAAVEAMNRHVPTGEDAAFASGWMFDKHAFQQHVGRLAVDLSDRGTFSGIRLLEVYEMLNGREICARLEDEPDQRLAATRLAESCANAPRKVQFFLFLDAGDRVRLAHCSGSQTEAVLLKACDFAIAEIEPTKLKLRDAVNHLDSQSLTSELAHLQAWNDLAATVGRTMAPLLEPDGEICFLPGRTFTGLPLHLVTLPDGRTLLEDRPVWYAPNLAVVSADLTVERDGEDDPYAAIVTVTTKNDSREFKKRATQTAQEIAAMMGNTGGVMSLSEESADLAAVLKAFTRASEILLLCHGTNAGPLKGAAICISSHNELPPSMLPVEQVPELARFLLCWEDLEDVERAPELVMSIACSSATPVINRTGSRHGLEQTLFSKGTRAIVSPLWDVEQEFASDWLRAFIEFRQTHADRTIPEIHRMACLRARDASPGLHPLAWGAFTVNGCLSA